MGTGVPGAGIIVFVPIIAGSYNRANIEKMQKEQYEKMLLDQERPGNYGSTDTIETLELFEDENGQMALAMETLSTDTVTSNLGITLECNGGVPKLYFYLGDVPKKHNPSLNLWTAAGDGPRTYHDPQEWAHDSLDYYSPVLSGEAARKAASNILQADGTFGNAAGTKVWLPDEHDFDQARQGISCL